MGAENLTLWEPLLEDATRITLAGKIVLANSLQNCRRKLWILTELRYLEDEETTTIKAIKGATTGLVARTIWCTSFATWYDVPRVERSIAFPGLIRTMRMMGNCGMTFAAIGGVYIGVEQLLRNYKMKRPFINGAVAGSSSLGYKGRSISSAISAGTTLAVTFALIDAESDQEN